MRTFRKAGDGVICGGDFEEQYRDLANSIIAQAVYDYCLALKTLVSDPQNPQASSAVRDCETFFCSQWFGVLTSISGPKLMAVCRDYGDEVFKSVHVAPKNCGESHCRKSRRKKVGHMPRSVVVSLIQEDLC